MPYTIRTLSGSGSDLFYPSFRKIHFHDSAAIVTISTYLRLAWTALPPGEEDTTVGSFMKANYEHRNEEELKAVLQNPDTSDTDSGWRQKIYYQWNHVFYDIGNFLSEVGPGIGHMQPPAHEVLPVNYPGPVVVGVGEVEPEGVKVVIWETNVLVLPAHLEPGISLRMAIVEGGQESGAETTVGTFDVSNGSEIWYIKEGTEVRIFVEGDYDKNQRGVAAVLVYGKLTKDEEEQERDEDGKEDIEEIFCTPSPIIRPNSGLP